MKRGVEALLSESPESLCRRHCSADVLFCAEAPLAERKLSTRIVVAHPIFHARNQAQPVLDPRLVHVVGVPKRARRAHAQLGRNWVGPGVAPVDAVGGRIKVQVEHVEQPLARGLLVLEELLEIPATSGVSPCARRSGRRSSRLRDLRTEYR